VLYYVKSKVYLILYVLVLASGSLGDACMGRRMPWRDE